MFSSVGKLPFSVNNLLLTAFEPVAVWAGMSSSPKGVISKHGKLTGTASKLKYMLIYRDRGSVSCVRK